jgi:hypothetical protein
LKSDDSQEAGSAELAEKDRADRRLTCLHGARVAPPKWQQRWLCVAMENDCSVST